MGISSVLTFDAHDPRVQNATPLNSVENIRPTYQFVKTLFSAVDDLIIDDSHMMVVSPDEGAMERAIYLAGVLFAFRRYKNIQNRGWHNVCKNAWSMRYLFICSVYS